MEQKKEGMAVTSILLSCCMTGETTLEIQSCLKLVKLNLNYKDQV